MIIYHIFPRMLAKHKFFFIAVIKNHILICCSPFICFHDITSFLFISRINFCWVIWFVCLVTWLVCWVTWFVLMLLLMLWHFGFFYFHFFSDDDQIDSDLESLTEWVGFFSLSFCLCQNKYLLLLLFHF